MVYGVDWFIYYAEPILWFIIGFIVAWGGHIIISKWRKHG